MRAKSSLAVLLLATACATTSAPGTYETILPAANGGERHVRVTLKPNGEAAMSSAFLDRPSRFLAQGTWKQTDRRIVVAFGDGKQMAFQLAGNQLVTKEWDVSVWGEKGPGVLSRVDRGAGISFETDR